MKANSELVGIWNINTTYTTETFAEFQIDTGRESDAIVNLIRLIEVYDEVAGTRNIRSIIARNGLGRAYAKQAKYELAVSQYLEALEIVDSYFQKDHTLNADIMKNLGKAYVAMGRMEEAKGLWTRAENVYTTAFGAANVLAIECKNLVASMLVKGESDVKGKGESESRVEREVRGIL